jgi:hypothetical protein
VTIAGFITRQVRNVNVNLAVLSIVKSKMSENCGRLSQADRQAKARSVVVRAARNVM